MVNSRDIENQQQHSKQSLGPEEGAIVSWPRNAKKSPSGLGAEAGIGEESEAQQGKPWNRSSGAKRLL